MQLREYGLADLGHDIDLGIDDFGNIVMDGCPEDDGRFIWSMEANLLWNAAG